MGPILIRRLGGRPNAKMAGLIIGVCFAVGLAGILLAHQYLVSREKQPNGGNNGGNGPGYVIYVGQVLNVPGDSPSDPVFDVPPTPKTVGRIPAGSGRVALTFDSGWEWEPAAPLLDVLKEYALRVTFFPRGKWIEDNPDLVRRILAEGHEIGSHSYTHPDLTKQSLDKIESEISLAKKALVDLAGEAAFVPIYRPPYGAHSDAVTKVLANHGYGWVVMWQVDSHDWMKTSGVQFIVDRVLGRVEDGGIVLLHIGRMETVQALPAIIEELLARDYEIVRVTDLLGIRHGDETGTSEYVVQKGDTLYSLARRFDTTVEDLLSLNPDIKPAPK